MKEKFLGKKGISTIELMIALTIISLVLAGAVMGNFSAQYWSIVGRTSNEALYKTKTMIEDLRSKIKQDFYSATSTNAYPSKDPSDPFDSSCISGGICYFVSSIISDISSCSKYLEAKVEWKNSGYPTTTTSLYTNLTNSNEIINRGGDCNLNELSGDWSLQAQSVGEVNFLPSKQVSGIDVLHGKIYITTNTFPSFLTYSVPSTIPGNPQLLGNYNLKINGISVKANAIDVEEDLSTGRTYAFVAIATTTKQLAVFDVTDPNNPDLKTQITLSGVDNFGSYPEGYRIYIYGQRLYITVRETSGTEFHIFNISTPTLPTEIGSGFELNRTINDFVVRDQKVGNSTKRFVFLTSDSDTKEFGILEVTNDVVTEISSIDLIGTQDGMSINIIGHKAYIGRKNNTSGPELYVFDIYDPTAPYLIQSGEVGSDVISIKIIGKYTFILTNKSGEELQVWNSDYKTWTPNILNSGRFWSQSFNNPALLGMDIDSNWLYLISSNSTSDKIKILYRP